MTEATRPAGSIYDLGYRSYEGERLGRPYAVLSLFIFSLRAIFGLGRSAWAKVLAFGLASIALVPALIQLGIAAVVPLEFEFVRPEDHFAYVQVIVAMFCALSAPEILGRDQRYQILPLYFSSLLTRVDYVTAKIAALVTALFVILALPLVLLVVGSAVADSDLLGYLQDNAKEFAPILGSSLLVAVFMAAVSLAIASQTSRRAISTAAVFGYFAISTAVGNILVETTTGDAASLSILISPLEVLDGAVRWMFGANPIAESAQEKAGLDGEYYLLTSFAYTLVALGVLLRRFLRMSV